MPQPKGNKSNVIYNSKTKAGLCKNKDCMKDRREKSAYCKQCSDENKNNFKSK